MTYDWTQDAFGCELPFAGATYFNMPTFPLWGVVPLPPLTLDSQSPQIMKIFRKLFLEPRKRFILFSQRLVVGRAFPRAKGTAGTKTSIF